MLRSEKWASKIVTLLWQNKITSHHFTFYYKWISLTFTHQLGKNTFPLCRRIAANPAPPEWIPNRYRSLISPNVELSPSVYKGAPLSPGAASCKKILVEKLDKFIYLIYISRLFFKGTFTYTFSQSIQVWVCTITSKSCT